VEARDELYEMVSTRYHTYIIARVDQIEWNGKIWVLSKESVHECQ
jgi:hypothetical protein